MINETIILKALRRGKKLNQYETVTKGVSIWFGLRRYTTHTTRLGAVIHRLRKRGYPIYTEMVENTGKGKHAVYSMSKDWLHIETMTGDIIPLGRIEIPN